MFTIHTIGGFNEVGKNMTVVDLGEDAVIFDMGFFLPALIEMEEKEKGYDEKKLRRIKAVPNDFILDKIGLRKKIRAILIGHAHLDHVGAVPYLEHRYNAEIAGTPFTIAFLKTLLRDNRIRLKNNIKTVQPNSSFIIKGKKNYKVEFINITHSTLQTSLIALHTKDGVILYANDFKLDNYPVVGKKPNYDRIKKLAKEGVKVLIVDALYAEKEGKTPSEKIARHLLQDVLLMTDNEKSGIIITTFSSHIARLKSIVDFGKQMGRKIVFVGRSLHKYVTVAKEVGLCPFEKSISLTSFRRQREKALQQVNKDHKKYMLVCTGHQGEPGSILDRISRNQLPFIINSKDKVIFSSKTIPAPANIATKSALTKRIKQKGARIFDEVHVSGHAYREDLRDLVELAQPEHIIPAHGDLQKLSAMAELAGEMGFRLGKQCHIMQDSQKLKVR